MGVSGIGWQLQTSTQNDLAQDTGRQLGRRLSARAGQSFSCGETRLLSKSCPAWGLYTSALPPLTPHSPPSQGLSKRQFLNFISLELLPASPTGWSPGTVSRTEVSFNPWPPAAWNSWAKGSAGAKVQMLALQVWLEPGQAQGEAQPAAAGGQGAVVLSWQRVQRGAGPGPAQDSLPSKAVTRNSW